MTSKPPMHQGLKHVALKVQQFDECAAFYTKILGMQIVWQPDGDNIYLSSGDDNLALHRATSPFSAMKQQQLDHIGFFLSEAAHVDQWYHHLLAHNVTIKALPKDHRDGTRSFYCADPDGNIIQMIYYPHHLYIK